MKKIKVLTLVLVLFIILAGAACSNQEADDKSSGADRITTEAAEKMTEHIRTPIDKARATQSLGDRRLEEMDKALRKQ